MTVDTIGRPLKDLRISVTDRCNFRCPYCMPAEIYGDRYAFLPRGNLLRFEEIERLTRIMVKLGVVKVRLTGGEPLVRKNIDKLVSMLSSIDGVHDLAMTTNAYLLPEMAERLKTAGLKRITVSLDSLDDTVFRKMNGRGYGTDKVLRGIASAEQAGLIPIKVNAVVQRGVNDHTILDLVRYCRDRGYIVRFIEYMDVGTLNGWKLDDVVPASDILELIDATFPLKKADNTYPGEVAQRYAFAEGSGEIGIISSVTAPFCGTCTRFRLSPEGRMFTCLFSSDGTDLRGPMREGATDAEMEKIITKRWIARDDRYSEIRATLTEPRAKKIEMYHIGG